MNEIICPYCDYVHYEGDMLKGEVDSDSGKFECEICEKVFRYEREYTFNTEKM